MHDYAVVGATPRRSTGWAAWYEQVLKVRLLREHNAAPVPAVRLRTLDVGKRAPMFFCERSTRTGRWSQLPRAPDVRLAAWMCVRVRRQRHACPHVSGVVTPKDEAGALLAARGIELEDHAVAVHPNLGQPARLCIGLSPSSHGIREQCKEPASSAVQRVCGVSRTTPSTVSGRAAVLNRRIAVVPSADSIWRATSAPSSVRSRRTRLGE